MRTADQSTPRTVAAGAGLILLVGAACYANALSGEFVFDDLDSIVGNASIRQPGSVWDAPPATTASGRPLLNLSLALNYAAGGHSVRGYHLLNVAVHLLAAVALFALARGTLLRPSIPRAFRARATAIGLALALAWVAHPIQTEAVTYVVQRCESLAALFCLLSLLCLLHSAEWAERAGRLAPVAARRPAFVARRNRASERAGSFAAGAVAACALGVLSKETAVIIPVLALLYDRAFLSGSFRESLRRRGGTFAGLFASWVLLAWLVHSTGGRGGSAGLGAAVPPLRYAAAQPAWILHYLRLSARPQPLVFDYGATPAPWSTDALPATLLVLALAGLSAAACLWRPALGFLPTAFFIALAPSSSFVPVATQVAAERRMYLPLAAVLAAAILAAVRASARLPLPPRARRALLVGLLAAWVGFLGVQTHARNEDYRSGLALWSDTAAKVPDNPRARTNLGRALLDAGRVDEAVAQLRVAVALAPDEARAHNALGFALARQGRAQEAVEHFRHVVRLDPGSPEAMENLATALRVSGQAEEAARWYRKVIARQPGNAAAHFGLGLSLHALGRGAEAAASIRTAGQLDPRFTGPPGPAAP